MKKNQTLLSYKDVLSITGYRSKVTIWRKVNNRTFPSPVRLSTHAIRWRKSDVDAWLDGLEEGFAVHPDKRETI